MWFGPWKDGERNGYGAYFDITAHTIQSGKWIGNELIAGTSYICKEKAEPVLPARTRTVSKPFSYSGTVRYMFGTATFYSQLCSFKSLFKNQLNKSFYYANEPIIRAIFPLF